MYRPLGTHIHPRETTMYKRLLAILFAAALIAAACGSDDDDSAADIQLATSDLGDILTDADGNTLYLFIPDGQGDSVCYDECEANWPIVAELTTAGDGLDASMLGTIERTTGDTQATYNGWPLYYFINDAAAGDTNGQGLNDVWYVISADGDAINPE